jgi:UDPglucose 6-dehydrogenase
MRLIVFGAGYVGLVTGTGLSELGHEVLCIDIDREKIDRLREGRVPFYEPGLAELVRRNVRAGRLQFDTRVSEPFDRADLYFIAVGTPPADDGAADLRAVYAVAEEIRKVARADAIVVVKSTVPVGTTDDVQARLASASVRLEAVSNPEFLKEGDALNDFFKPDRIVVGARTTEAAEAMRRLYAPLQIVGDRMVITDPRSSELVKYASNTMLAMRVSFMNEMSRLCHATGANVHAVRLGMGADTRIGPRFLYAGPGYGGSCFPKDVQALVALGRQKGVPMRIAEATQNANDEQARFLLQLVEEAVGPLQGKTIALWGLAFKPETDDVRDAPSLRLAERLLERGAKVVGHDPEAMDTFRKVMGSKVTISLRDYDALDGADALVLLTEWRAYRAPNFAEIAKRLRSSGTTASGITAPVVIDARNVWRAAEVKAAGLRYVGIGVPC